jgi:hypothetical protein
MGLSRLLGRWLQASIQPFLDKKEVEAWEEFVRFGGTVAADAGLEESEMKEIFASMMQSRSLRRPRVPMEITRKLIESQKWKEAALQWVQPDRTYIAALSAVASLYYLGARKEGEESKVVKVAKEVLGGLRKSGQPAGQGQTQPAQAEGQPPSTGQAQPGQPTKAGQGQTTPAGPAQQGQPTKPEQAGQGQAIPVGPAQPSRSQRPAEGQTTPAGPARQGQPTKAEQAGQGQTTPAQPRPAEGQTTPAGPAQQGRTPPVEPTRPAQQRPAEGQTPPAMGRPAQTQQPAQRKGGETT